MDIIRPLKLESNIKGTEIDLGPTEADPQEDYISAKGFIVRDVDAIRIDDDGNGNLIFRDSVSGGPHTLADLLSVSSGLTPSTHKALDQLVHLLDENCYEDRTYNGWKVTNITWWTDSNKTLKIREVDYTYSGWKVTQIVGKQYNATGLISESITGNIVYDGWKIDYITWSVS